MELEHLTTSQRSLNSLSTIRSQGLDSSREVASLFGSSSFLIAGGNIFAREKCKKFLNWYFLYRAGLEIIRTKKKGRMRSGAKRATFLLNV
jgi:hypothetical protein